MNDIGLFVTSITTPDNVRTYVGNDKLFAEAGFPAPEQHFAVGSGA